MLDCSLCPINGCFLALVAQAAKEYSKCVLLPHSYNLMFISYLKLDISKHTHLNDQKEMFLSPLSLCLTPSVSNHLDLWYIKNICKDDAGKGNHNDKSKFFILTYTQHYHYIMVQPQSFCKH